MNRRTLLIALTLALALALGAGFFFWPRQADEGGAGTSDEASDPNAPGPAASPAAGGPVEPPPLTMAADPTGHLVLEGQVIDDYDDPIAGAIVTLSSNPPRKALTGEDGTFSFDRLIGKTYAVTARKEDMVGGPVAMAKSMRRPPRMCNGRS